MSQTKKQTVVEVVTSTATGAAGSWLICVACFHLFQSNLMAAATAATIGCTVWSLVRDRKSVV